MTTFCSSFVEHFLLDFTWRARNHNLKHETHIAAKYYQHLILMHIILGKPLRCDGPSAYFELKISTFWQPDKLVMGTPVLNSAQDVKAMLSYYMVAIGKIVALLHICCHSSHRHKYGLESERRKACSSFKIERKDCKRYLAK